MVDLLGNLAEWFMGDGLTNNTLGNVDAVYDKAAAVVAPDCAALTLAIAALHEGANFRYNRHNRILSTCSFYLRGKVK